MMNEILDVQNLCKNYSSFSLDNVSFSLEKGKITGFIGRNGAGKSTTLNAILDFAIPDEGEIHFFGERLCDNEVGIKQKIGFVTGGINYYQSKKIKKITEVTKLFYPNWNEAAYRDYLKKFSLDENKKASEFSTGMKIKYSLALALSHNADLLILDEPTSGLDPVSREDLLEIFLELCDKGKTILFSTHITSDLEKCADNIIYIRNGRIIAQKSIKSFINQYRLVEFEEGQFPIDCEQYLIGQRRSKNGFTALVNSDNADKINLPLSNADLDSILVHLEREGE